MGQLGFTGDESPLGKTSSIDLRRILRAQYTNADSNPVLAGGDVSGRPDRAYAYGDGVGVMQVGNGAVILTWAAGQTSLVSQPSTPRTDIIYCDASGAVRVGTEGVVPENDVIVIRKMTAPAGMTATNQATLKHMPNWAMPYGAQLGILKEHEDSYIVGTEVTKSRHVLANLPFYVPTRRDIFAEYHQCIYSSQPPYTNDFTSFGPGSMLYQLFIDGALEETWEMEYNRIHASRTHTVRTRVEPGMHTARLERLHNWGVTPLHSGGGGAPDRAAKSRFMVIDRGVAE